MLGTGFAQRFVTLAWTPGEAGHVLGSDTYGGYTSWQAQEIPRAEDRWGSAQCREESPTDRTY